MHASTDSSVNDFRTDSVSSAKLYTDSTVTFIDNDRVSDFLSSFSSFNAEERFFQTAILKNLIAREQMQPVSQPRISTEIKTSSEF